jgi:hypothetical protein
MIQWKQVGFLKINKKEKGEMSMNMGMLLFGSIGMVLFGAVLMFVAGYEKKELKTIISFILILAGTYGTLSLLLGPMPWPLWVPVALVLFLSGCSLFCFVLGGMFREKVWLENLMARCLKKGRSI